MRTSFSGLAVMSLLVGPTPALTQPVSTEAWWAATDPNGRQVVYIQCGSNFFDPKEVVVKKGIPVWMVVRTTGLTSNSFGFGDPNFPGRGPVRAEPTVLQFVPSAQGRFSMGCEAESGLPEGEPVKARKRGTLTVIP